MLDYRQRRPPQLSTSELTHGIIEKPLVLDIGVMSADLPVNPAKNSRQKALIAMQLWDGH